jgi:hypothetical protein
MFTIIFRMKGISSFLDAMSTINEATDIYLYISSNGLEIQESFKPRTMAANHNVPRWTPSWSTGEATTTRIQVITVVS